MIIHIFLSISALVHTWLYSTYAVFFCLLGYAALLTWLYNVLFESSPVQASWKQILQEKVNQFFNDRFIDDSTC